LWIEWSHVTKLYESHNPRQRSIGLLDFAAFVQSGITVILGPGGSGKSTLLCLTATLMLPDDGRITFGLDDGSEYIWSRGEFRSTGTTRISELKSKIAFIPPARKITNDIPLEESLLYLAKMRRVPRARKRCQQLIARWGLGGYRKTPLCKLSGAVLKRFLLAQSLIADPLIWILDDPTEGMDAPSKQLLFQELSRHPRNRITLIATHDLELAEYADDLLLLESGRCRRIGKRKYLTAGVPEGTVAAWYQMMQTFSYLRSKP
jgi:ABC-2 type transport system ATP-binding protein